MSSIGKKANGGTSKGAGGGRRKGQSLEDKLYAFKYFISGQGICFVVLKATTCELIGPKKKHLNYLVCMTNETNVSMPNLTKYLMQRSKHTEWCVSFKALITIHHLMSYGNERFIQNLATSTVNNRSFDILANYVDRSSTLAYDMSTFVRRYSLYLNAKIHTYRLLGLDFCLMMTKTDKLTGCGSLINNQPISSFKDMQLDQLTKILPILQSEFDALIAFDASIHDLNNGIINRAFSALYKDFVKLYIAYQAAILRLLDQFFVVHQLKRAQEMYDAYRKFLVRMEQVSDFMRVVDSVGMDKSDLPNVSKTPAVSISMLENHLKQLDTANKRTLSIDAGVVLKWQPVKAATTSSSSSQQPQQQQQQQLKRNSLSSRGASLKLPQKMEEIPRLKSPDETRKKHKQPRARYAILEPDAAPIGSSTKCVPSKNGETETGDRNDCDKIERENEARSVVASDKFKEIAKTIELTTPIDTESDLLLLDIVDDNNQPNDLIITTNVNKPACSSNPGSQNLVGYSQQPADWVKV